MVSDNLRENPRAERGGFPGRQPARRLRCGGPAHGTDRTLRRTARRRFGGIPPRLDPLRQRLHLVAATSEQTRDLELFQLQAEEGPCIECYRTGEPVLIADMATHIDRWPRFGTAATEAGFASDMLCRCARPAPCLAHSVCSIPGRVN